MDDFLAFASSGAGSQQRSGKLRLGHFGERSWQFSAEPFYPWRTRRHVGGVTIGIADDGGLGDTTPAGITPSGLVDKVKQADADAALLEAGDGLHDECRGPLLFFAVAMREGGRLAGSVVQKVVHFPSPRLR